MSGWMVLFAVGVVGSLAAIAVVDARTMTVPVKWLVGLLVAGLGWLALGGGLRVVGSGPWMHVLGVVVGIGVPAAMILGAQLLGRRWPIFPGDALLLGTVGMILGLKSFLWALSLGCALAVLHRMCLQRRRRRPLFAGYLAAGPGLAAGAVAMFVVLHAQFAFAEKPLAPAGADPGRIQAIELLPVKNLLPEELAGKVVELDVPAPLAFGALVALIGNAAEVAVEIEERPSRLVDGGAELRAPEPLVPGSGKTLALLLDSVAGSAGYAWEWKDDRVVFYRYWDRSWPGAEVVEVEAPKGPFDGVMAWISRVLGGAEKEDGSGSGVGPERPAEVGEAVAEKQGEAIAGAEEEVTAEVEAVEEASEMALPLTLAAAPEDLTVWEVDPARQRTVRGVVEAWADRAEWKLAWQADQDFSVAAEASFEGDFLEAVDGLLSDPRLARVLTVSAHANRYLVVQDAAR